jgi:acyl carrier protein
VARGYLGRAGLTAERFVPDPFSPGAGARLYRTGDLGRWRMDGTLEFLGRLDRQVKVRGFRVELEEVEAALACEPSVARAAVAAVDGPAGGRLVAYVVPEDGRPVEASALRDALRRSLPEYMVPGAIVELDALPLTANGKLDRARLPDPTQQTFALDESYVAPRDEVEEAIERVWRELLGLERVGVHDRFFEIGGHSLLAARVVSALREPLGVELPLREVFEHPTIAELAVAVRLAPKTRLPAIEPRPRVPFAAVGAEAADG